MPYKDQEKKREHSRLWAAKKRLDPVYLERIRQNNRRAATKYRMMHPDRAVEWERIGKGRWIRAAKSADGSVTTEVLNDLLACPICPYCNVELNRDNVTIDHIVPISKGGTHTADNLAAVCKSCNQTKHSMSLISFLLRRTGPTARV